MNLRHSFAIQAEACGQLGSPFMEQLMRVAGARIDDQTQTGRFLLEWRGDAGPSADSLPLRFAGALHNLVIRGVAPALAAVYPPKEVASDILWDAVQAAMIAHDRELVEFMQSPPQTNELRRSVALVPLLHRIAAETGKDLALLELGASAGLNLLCDSYFIRQGTQSYGPDNSSVSLCPEVSGNPPAPANLVIESRQGVDLRPFDLANPEQQRRLLSYLWPDQPDRMENTKAAIELFLTSNLKIDQDDAIDWLEQKLTTPRSGVVQVIYHTVAWQYFPAEVKERGETLIRQAGARATKDAPLARISMEADGNSDKGAALRLCIWPGPTQQLMARVDFHGRWIEWT